ncbi:MAG: maleylpyruvate isomerase family mycothiol-dependent enzyme [Acidimicrobiia bacterium]
MSEPARDDLAALVADLAAEQGALRTTLECVRGDDWFRPVPARGWDVRDTVAHLADTDELAIDTCLGGDRPLNDFASRLASPEDVTLWGVLRGRAMPGAAVLDWWFATSARERSVLRGLDSSDRVPWGLGMRAPSFVTARLMECWAHGLDVHAALGTAPADTDRLRHVAWLSIRALPYAFGVAGRSVPSGELLVRLRAPSGVVWTFGPDDAPNVIEGEAGQFCRLFVHRLALGDASSLRAHGEGAIAALEVARSFL